MNQNLYLRQDYIQFRSDVLGVKHQVYLYIYIHQVYIHLAVNGFDPVVIYSSTEPGFEGRVMNVMLGMAESLCVT